MFGSKRMWRFTIPAAVFTLLFLAATDSNISLAGPLVRVKDISRIKGMRPNQLVGRGLIVGLNGTGDKEAIAFGMIANMLRHNGLEIDKDKVKLKNVAAVMVTCTIPPFAKEGDQLNVSVSSLADAKSLKGGTLIQTPLLGADGKIYAVAQGSISLGGGETQGGGGAVHTLVGLIPRGAVVEREIPMSYSEGNEVSLILREKDFTTASRLARSINKHFPGEMAKAIDPGQVKVSVPFSYRNQVVDFISA
ncbi:MAG: flagellar basal body P-ring protein FlgI, partial [bacterium]|nr:flagellar basal body P-ring protein FlgI [bacterium]